MHTTSQPSHLTILLDIRSPLNVVHAGLDILRSEMGDALSTGPGAKFISDLVEDIFQSSQSAIEVLNDLLSYEHIDAGE